MRRAGQGRSSGAVRSATQKRVRSWWSRAVDSGLETSERSTEARMSSMSMAEAKCTITWVWCAGGTMACDKWEEMAERRRRKYLAASGIINSAVYSEST